MERNLMRYLGIMIMKNALTYILFLPVLTEKVKRLRIVGRYRGIAITEKLEKKYNLVIAKNQNKEKAFEPYKEAELPRIIRRTQRKWKARTYQANKKCCPLYNGKLSYQ